MKKLSKVFDLEKLRRGLTIVLSLSIIMFLFGATFTGIVFGFLANLVAMRFGFVLTLIFSVGVIYGIIADDMPMHKTIGLISFALLGGSHFAKEIENFLESIRGNLGFTIAAVIAAILIIVLNAIPKKEKE